MGLKIGVSVSGLESQINTGPKKDICFLLPFITLADITSIGTVTSQELSFSPEVLYHPKPFPIYNK